MLTSRLLPDEPSAVDGLLHTDALQKWLEALPRDKPMDTLPRLCAELQRVAAADFRTRLKLLDLIRRAAELQLELVENSLRPANLPLTPELLEAAKAGDRLLEELGSAYFTISQHLAVKWNSIGLRTPLHLAVVRAMQAYSSRLQFAYRAYMPPSPSAWPILHRLYALACEHSFGLS